MSSICKVCGYQCNTVSELCSFCGKTHCPICFGPKTVAAECCKSCHYEYIQREQYKVTPTAVEPIHNVNSEEISLAKDSWYEDVKAYICAGGKTSKLSNDIYKTFWATLEKRIRDRVISS